MTLRHYLHITQRLLIVSAGVAFAVYAAGRALHRTDSYEKKMQSGGDIEIADWEKIPADIGEILAKDGGEVSRTAETSIAAQFHNTYTNVSLKAIDSKYPLYGQLQLRKGNFTDPFFALPRERLYGAAVDKYVIKELGVKMGDVIRINDSYFQVTAYIINEPDAAVGAMGKLPRMITNIAGLSAVVNLEQSSELRTIFRCRIKLPPMKTAEKAAEPILSRFPDTTWKLRTWQEPRF